MVHTVAHLTVHHGALDGALSRLGQFFVAPLLLEEAAAREVSNVHSEFSRNCNSDARKVLQVRTWCAAVCGWQCRPPACRLGGACSRQCKRA